ncbi:MAG: phosphomannomutase/phosphoglucomutase [Alphaproteobacteria bacterium]|nr:phosphomannomutase/phosphoglucomutase [Alphaproteobacteria bacterium]
MPHRFDPTILREYDIRGIVGDTLSTADAQAIGRAYALTLKASGGRRVAVGYDGRLTSPELAAALVDGLVSEGTDVLRIGRGPTPMLYYAAATLGVDGGIMITGSHNPPEYNGFKFVLRGRAFYGAAIQSLAETALTLEAPQAARGRIEDRDIRDAYVERLARDYHGSRPLIVAWDPGNGATGEIVQQLTARLPGRHVLINAAIDGHFPAHHPDPTVPENLVQLRQMVAREGCELGIAFDGDGDRIGVVDATGEIWWGDQLMIILAREVLARHPGALILADVKASQVLFDEIARAGGRPVMTETGHSPIKAKLAETGAPLAGEMSGHIFFADSYYGFDDAVYVAIRLLDILARSPQSLAELRRGLPSVVNTPELRFPCAEARKFAIVREVAGRLQQAAAEVNEIDGVRVRTVDGWWLLRASNTQDVLVARAESGTAEGLARLKAELAAQLAASGVALPDA